MRANVEAEKMLLGCVLADHSIFAELSVQPENFAYHQNAKLFAWMQEVAHAGHKVDYLSLLDRAGDDNEAREYIVGLTSLVPSAMEFGRYERIVIDAWKLRKAIEIMGEFTHDVSTAVDADILADTIRRLSSLDEKGRDDDYDFASRVMQVVDELQTEDDGMNGISTGLRDLDAYTNGLQDGDLIVIGARPSMGKTALALHMTASACAAKSVGVLFSLEMDDRPLIKRMLAAQAHINSTKMRSAKKFFVAEDWDNMSRAVSDVMGWQLKIYDKSSVTLSEIRSKVRRLRRAHMNEKMFVIVDYLQLISRPGKQNTVQELGDISRGLKGIARDYRLPVVVLSQLSRKVEERADKVPVMSDLRESGAIEQDADVVILMYRDDYYNPESEYKNVVDLIIGKQRNGPTGRTQAVYLRDTNRFVNLERRG